MTENTRDLFVGLFVGGLIGAALGILFAPKSGKETRDEINSETKELLGKAKDEYRKATEKWTEAIQSSKSKVKGAIDAGVQAYREADIEKKI